MFQELIELFKRFVAAQEKQAEAAMLMAAQNYHATPKDLAQGYGAPNGTECTAPKTEEEGKPLPDWNPYTEKVQGKYGKDKQQILDNELEAKGISVKANATGAEKHQALLSNEKHQTLLDHGNPAAHSSPPADPAPAIEPEVLPPAEPEVTLEALKATAGLYCARRKVAGSEAPAADCAALLQNFSGVGKTMEVPANLRKACLDAFEANWMPEEEL